MNKMKCTIIIVILLISMSNGIAQNQYIESKSETRTVESQSGTFKLFPTQNYWTFIKLNTRNGKMWQVHFAIDDDGATGELVLNPLSLVGRKKEENNRFNLYPTENIYNFILLDQIDGRVYQVQWSMEEKYRGVIPIN